MVLLIVGKRFSGNGGSFFFQLVLCEKPEFRVGKTVKLIAGAAANLYLLTHP